MKKNKFIYQLKKLKNNFYILFGLVMFLVVLIFAAAAPLITNFRSDEMFLKDRLTAPNHKYIMGTDDLGRDIFSRVCHGARTSISIGFVVVALTTLSGTIVGLFTGYYEIVDSIVSRILDGLMAFPDIVLAITLAAAWGPGIKNIIYVLTFAYFPKMARIVRANVISVKSMEYIESGRAIGASNLYLIAKYILPACISPIIVQATFCFAASILAEASLSFLGVGIKDPSPSLGGMISVGRNFIEVAPWIVLFPGGGIIIAVLGLNLLGDGLRDMYDPKLKD
jgi:peptide/nickel transport system permease protein